MLGTQEPQPRKVASFDSEADPARQAEYLLYYDELTGLYNRRFYNKAYPEECARALADQKPLSLILIDVDFFKSINDRYGHQQGDSILAGVGTLINETVGTRGYPIRYAGDEFVVLLPGVPAADVTEIAQQLWARVREHPFRLLNTRRTVQVTFSLGVAHHPEDTDHPSRLFECADRAAYLAKRNGRDQVVAYQPEVEQVLDATQLYQYFPCPRLVARSDLVVDLADHLSGRSDGARPWFIVTGPAGVGKSRILQELHHRVDPQRQVLLEAAGLPHRQGQPFGFLVDALSSHIRLHPMAGQQMASALDTVEISVVSKLLPDLSRHSMLAAPPGSTGDVPETPRDVHIEAFCKMLLALGNGHAPLLMFDDFHWADQGTIQVLESLKERDPNTFVCLSLRNDEASLEKNMHLTELLGKLSARGASVSSDLRPLDAEQVAEMLDAILPGAAIHAELIGLVHEKSGGFPLLVEEILKFLIQRNCITYRSSQLVVGELPAEQIPTEPGRLHEVRAGQLDEEVRGLMARAAVIGTDFDFSTLLLLEGRDEGYLRGLLERARKAHIISEVWSEDANRISFISSQAHEAFYKSLDPDERRKLHLKVGKLRERQYAGQFDSALSELAYHFVRAGDPDRAQQYVRIITELYGKFASPEVVVVGRADDIRGLVEEDEAAPDLLPLAVQAARIFKSTLTHLRMYGTEYLQRRGEYDQLFSAFELLLARSEEVTWSEVGGRIVLNGMPLPSHSNAGSIIHEVFAGCDIKGLTMHRGLTVGELRACLEFFALPRGEVRARGGLGKLLEGVDVRHLVPNERLYVAVGERDILVKRGVAGEEVLIKEVEGEVGLSPPASDLSQATVFRARDAGLAGRDGRGDADWMVRLSEMLEKGPSAEEDEGLLIDRIELQKILDAQAEVAEWQRQIARYIDLHVMDDLRRDWGVLASDLESGNRVKIAAASRVYLEAEEASLEPLVRFASRTVDRRARKVAVALLRRLTPDACDRLLLALYAAQAHEEKCHLIEALEDFRDAGVALRLQPFVQHPVGTVRKAALQSLAMRGDPVLLEAVLSALGDDRSEVRVDAVAALGEFGVEGGAPDLLELIRPCTVFVFERDPLLQAQACQSLGELGDRRAVPALMGILRGATWPTRTKPAVVRAAAAVALTQLARRVPVEGLERALEKAVRDRDVMIRSAAKLALDKLHHAGVEEENRSAGVMRGGRRHVSLMRP